ncbi:MAG: hypothetical protein AB9917_11245 [Negativicutes bacterium]
MASIVEARKMIKSFIEQEFEVNKDAIKIVTLMKKGKEWLGVFTVTENNRYLEKLGYPTIFDKNTYTIKLNQELEVVSYTAGEPNEEEA